MSDTEEKVFNLILEASYAKRGVLFDQCKLRDIPDIAHDALAYSIEQHEATKRENEQLRAALLEIRDCTTEHGGAAKALKIINAALEARGLEIKEKEQ